MAYTQTHTPKRYVLRCSFTRERLEQATAALHIEYGSRDQRATHVVYTNGMLDPWLDHGITDDVIPGSHVINLPCKLRGVSDCA